MIITTMIATFGGLISATIPDLVSLFRDRSDKKHEIEILKLQIARENAGHNHKIEEIRLDADIAESKALYKTWKTDVRWVDALNGTVRPVLAYTFFALYAAIKVSQVWSYWGAFEFMQMLQYVWSAEDQAIFAAIISFYFGQRSMAKYRNITG